MDYWTTGLDYWSVRMRTTSPFSRERPVGLYANPQYPVFRNDPIVLGEMPPSSSRSQYPWLKVDNSPVKLGD